MMKTLGAFLLIVVVGLQFLTLVYLADIYLQVGGCAPQWIAGTHDTSPGNTR